MVLTQTSLDFGTSTTLDTDSLSLGGNVVLSTESLTIGPTPNVVVDNTGIQVGDASFTESGLTLENMNLTGSSLTLGNTAAFTSTSLTMGDSGNVVVNATGLYLDSPDAAIFFGPNGEWKLEFDSVSESLLFQFWDTATESYISKLELRNST
jgi:hypothetical protein